MFSHGKHTHKLVSTTLITFTFGHSLNFPACSFPSNIISHGCSSLVKIPTLGENNSVCAENGHCSPSCSPWFLQLYPHIEAKSVEQLMHVHVYTVCVYILCLCACWRLFKTTTVSALPTPLPASCLHEWKLLPSMKNDRAKRWRTGFY